MWEMKEEGGNVHYLDKPEGRTNTGEFKGISTFLLVVAGLQAGYGSHCTESVRMMANKEKDWLFHSFNSEEV